MNSSNYYAIQVETGKEDTIRDLIDSFDLDYVDEVFVPKVKRVKNFKDVRKLADVVMFPGYIIIKTSDPRSLYLRLSVVPRLTKILGKEHGMFFPIYEEEISLLHILLNKEKEVEMSIGVIENDKVIITKGPLAGNEGIIKKINRHKKICIIETNFCGSSTSCAVGLEIISKC